MTNLLTPLKKLGKKMTGQDISGSNLVTVVDDIANKYTGGSGGGDSGGGGCDCQPAIAHAVVDPDTEIISVTDMTAGEMYSFVEAGKLVTLVINDYYSIAYILGALHEEGEENYTFEFNGVETLIASSADDYPVSDTSGPK